MPNHRLAKINSERPELNRFAIGDAHVWSVQFVSIKFPFGAKRYN